MKNCVGIADLLCAYADNELDETNKQLVEDHLAICENCSALLKIYREMSLSVSESNVPAPDALRMGVMNRIKSESVPRATENNKQRRMYKYILTRYAPVAACLVAVLLVWQFWGNIFGTNNAAMPAAAPEMAAPASPEAAMYSADAAPAAPESDSPMPQAMPAEEGHNDMQDDDTTRIQAGGTLSWMQHVYQSIPGIEPLDEEDENLFKEAYAVIAIIGEYPGILADYEPTPDWNHGHSGWEMLFIIPIPMVADLIEEVGGNEDVTILFNETNTVGNHALVLLSYGL